jgi:hypothetical protein
MFVGLEQKIRLPTNLRLLLRLRATIVWVSPCMASNKIEPQAWVSR